MFCKNEANEKAPSHGKALIVFNRKVYFASLIAACAAARRAIGTRNGEQDT